MFVGQASALGLAINIPVLIRSLSNTLFLPSTNSLSSNLGSVHMLVLEAIANDNIATHLVDTYSLNWWDNNKVKKSWT